MQLMPDTYGFYIMPSPLPLESYAAHPHVPNADLLLAPFFPHF